MAGELGAFGPRSVYYYFQTACATPFLAGEVLIRCNNVMYLRKAPEAESAAAAMEE